MTLAAKFSTLLVNWLYNYSTINSTSTTLISQCYSFWLFFLLTCFGMSMAFFIVTPPASGAKHHPPSPVFGMHLQICLLCLQSCMERVSYLILPKIWVDARDGTCLLLLLSTKTRSAETPTKRCHRLFRSVETPTKRCHRLFRSVETLSSHLRRTIGGYYIR